MDPAILYHVFVSTYYDIWRYKEMHLTDPRNQLSDSVKRVAYFTKWITKLRPFWIDRSTYDPNICDLGVFLNEEFAIELAYANFNFELGRPVSDPMPALTSDKLMELLYDLHFRELSDDALIHIFQDIYDIARHHGILLDE